jgi:hypothetical protein
VRIEQFYSRKAQNKSFDLGGNFYLDICLNSDAGCADCSFRSTCNDSPGLSTGDQPNPNLHFAIWEKVHVVVTQS